MVTIGVTGHRFLADVDRLTAGIDEALRQIEVAFPGRPLTVISPLAEGADRLVARRALARHGTRLIVPLPLPQTNYMADFATKRSRAEFLALLRLADETIVLSPAETREAAYEAVGRFILDRCDVLLAVWDGKAARGRGGTGEIVALARARGLPMAWVHIGNRKPGDQEITAPGTEQGAVSFERFPR
jgi:hypothetical protein